jgi:hypothetical protein
LKNFGSTTATLNGAYVFYTSSGGTFTTLNSHALPNITLGPGQIFLIQEGSGGGFGIDLPTPDATGTLNISASAGKLAIAKSSAIPTGSTDTNLVDFVGFGTTANDYYVAAAPAPNNANSINRVATNNNNSTDYALAAPSPKNMASLSVSDINPTGYSFVKNTFVKSDINFGSSVKDVKIYNMLGQVVRTVSLKNSRTINVSDLPKGNYIVTGTINNIPVSEKILKD